MKTYEYVVESYTSLNELPSYLNNMGWSGWRVVSVIIISPRMGNVMVVYERELNEKSDENS
jgi:hypothetical protein